MQEELPKLQTKQQNFVSRYVANGLEGPSDAYSFAYDCKNMSKEAIAVEAQKLLKNPKIALWIDYAKKNMQKVAVDELNYSIKDCFDELADVQRRAKEGNGNFTQEIKAIELKGKLAGHFVDKHQVTGGSLADVLDQLK